MSLYSEWNSGLITDNVYSVGCYNEEKQDIAVYGWDDEMDPWEDDYQEETVWCADCIHYKVCKFATDEEGACGSYIAKEEFDE